MFRQTKMIPINALLAPPAEESNAASTPRQMLDLADIVYLVSEDSERDILVFGKDKLAQIAKSDIPEGARVLRVGIERHSDQLDNLLSLVQSVKGSHDYAESL